MGVVDEHVSAADVNALMREMLAMMRENSAQTAQMVQTMAQASLQQSELIRSWLDMFKTPTAPLQSTTVEERENLRLIRDEANWEPMTAQLMKELFKDTPTDE